MDALEFEQTAIATLRAEPRIPADFLPTAMELDADGTLILEGEVDTVAQKRLVLERLAALPEVDGIADRLRIRPIEPMSDGGIRDHLKKAFLNDPSFYSTRVVERSGEAIKVLNDVHVGPEGEIEFEVDEGVVTLNGSVSSLASKRLAGVFAWIIPGTRDVINGIAVEPEEEDAPIRIEEAVRLALELDPFVDDSQVRVGVRHRVVRLTGFVPSAEIRMAAENDAWYVFGVDDVINEIVVQS